MSTMVDNSMTCQDCVHFTEREHKSWHTFTDLGYCDKAMNERIEVKMECPVNHWCDNKFEPKNDSWESVSK